MTVRLDPETERILRLWRKEYPERRGLRAEIVLRAAAGHANLQIAQDLSVSRNTVKLWRSRFAKEGLAGLKPRRIPGRPKKANALPQESQRRHRFR
ncbi:MAG: helix-turn-helix domain-containing protein [Elusimicrobiota bacterium]